jgi:Ras-related protein Rab-6A
MPKQTKAEHFPKYKIVFLGDTAVGKTTLISKYVFSTVTKDLQPTIGIDFFAQNIVIGKKKVNLQLWDTAGQERFRSLIPNYTRDSFMAVVLFDHTQKETFENVDSWIEDFVLKNNTKSVRVVIVGNKSDLKAKAVKDREGEFVCARSTESITKAEIEEKARKYGAMYASTCSLTDDGIADLVKIIESTVEAAEEPEDRGSEFDLEARPSRICACM